MFLELESTQRNSSECDITLDPQIKITQIIDVISFKIIHVHTEIPKQLQLSKMISKSSVK